MTHRRAYASFARPPCTPYVDSSKQRSTRRITGVLPRSQAADTVTLTRTDTKLDPGLYIVATPIGNLQDITLRALHVLKAADAILAEDTRHSRKLLQAFSLDTPLVSFHAFNEKEKQEYVLQRLASGQVLALVSDAGTPVISDPGAFLIEAAIAQGHKVVPVPGPSALLAALVASGLPSTSFLFHGFLPPKSGARRRELEGLRAVRGTLVFYVPPHGLRAVLVDVAAVLGGGRCCCLARELTKVHEEFIRGTVAEVVALYEVREPRGEFVVLVGAPVEGSKVQGGPEEVDEAVKQLLQDGLSLSQVAKSVARQMGVSKNAAYDAALRVQQDGSYGSTTS